jgi:hypothetical protein
MSRRRDDTMAWLEKVIAESRLRNGVDGPAEASDAQEDDPSRGLYFTHHKCVCRRPASHGARQLQCSHNPCS